MKGVAIGWRLGAGYKSSGIHVQGIYESINSNDNDVLDRDAYGANVAMKFGEKNTIGVQYLVAKDYKNSSNTGFDMVSVGWTRKLDKRTSMYAMYSQTNNDDNADYQGVDGGHGDEVKTDRGGKPSAFSVGLVFKF